MADLWPSNVPKVFDVDSYQREFPDNTIWSETMSGRIRARRVSTKLSETISGDITMSTAEMNSFHAFFVTTLKDGSRPFQNFNHPHTGANSVWMFKDRPSIKPWGGSGIYYVIGLVLMWLPDAPA